MGMTIKDLDESSSDLKVMWWKPGYNKPVLVNKDPEDANFNAWVQMEIDRAPKDMIFFFVVLTTDI